MTRSQDSSYLAHLETISQEDVRGLKKAQESYGDSWKRRGGVGAFMMLARKWDRLENRVSTSLTAEAVPASATFVSTLLLEKGVHPYDIFGHVAADKRAEGLIDDIRDLRRYLMLVEAEMRVRGSQSANSTHRDNS